MASLHWLCAKSPATLHWGVGVSDLRPSQQSHRRSLDEVGVATISAYSNFNNIVTWVLPDHVNEVIIVIIVFIPLPLVIRTLRILESPQQLLKMMTLSLTLFSSFTLTNSLSLCTRFREVEEGACLKWKIFCGFRLLGFKSIDSIFFNKIRFSFCCSMYLVRSILVFCFLATYRWEYCGGALVSTALFTLFNLFMCISCS